MEEYSSKIRSKYERMTTEELEELIELDSCLEDGESLTTDELVIISEIIAERDFQAGKYTEKDVQAAKERFYEKYYPIKDPVPLWDFDADSAPVMKKQTERPVKSRRFVRLPIAAVIAIALVIMLAVTAYATDLKTVIVQTAETFNVHGLGGKIFSSGAEIPEVLTELKENMEKSGIDTALLPTSFPEGYECAESNSELFGGKPFANAVLTKGDINIVIFYQDTLDGQSSGVFQKDEGDAAVYYHGNNVFYITTNVGNFSAVWMSGTVLCSVSGVPDYDTLLEIIESIGA